MINKISAGLYSSNINKSRQQNSNSQVKNQQSINQSISNDVSFGFKFRWPEFLRRKPTLRILNLKNSSESAKYVADQTAMKKAQTAIQVEHSKYKTPARLSKKQKTKYHIDQANQEKEFNRLAKKAKENDVKDLLK